MSQLAIFRRRRTEERSCEGKTRRVAESTKSFLSLLKMHKKEQTYLTPIKLNPLSPLYIHLQSNPNHPTSSALKLIPRHPPPNDRVSSLLNLLSFLLSLVEEAIRTADQTQPNQLSNFVALRETNDERERKDELTQVSASAPPPPPRQYS